MNSNCADASQRAFILREKNTGPSARAPLEKDARALVKTSPSFLTAFRGGEAAGLVLMHPRPHEQLSILCNASLF